MSSIQVPRKKERPGSDQFLRLFYVVALSWIGCAIVRFGLAYLSHGKISENGGNGPVGAIVATRMLAATFGAPIFIVAAIVCLAVAAVTYRGQKWISCAYCL